MKKLLGISLVAVLAATPLMANAAAPAMINQEEAGLASDGTNVVTSTKGKYFAGKTIETTDAEKVATGAYVKGAYNAAISAINRVAEDTATSAGAGIDKTSGKFSLDVTKDANNNNANISGLQFDGSGDAATVSVKAGNGIAVDANGVQVSVSTDKGLDFDSTNHTLEIKDGAGIKTGSNGIEVDLLTNGGLATDSNGQLYVDGLSDFAKKEGVVNTIESSYVEDVVTDAVLSNNGVTALTTWGNDAATSTLGAASLTVTRENKAVKVANSGTAQDPVYYTETATNLTTLNVTPDTEVKTTPDANAAWTSQS
jgi:hypothetical protein